MNFNIIFDNDILSIIAEKQLISNNYKTIVTTIKYYSDNYKKYSDNL